MRHASLAATLLILASLNPSAPAVEPGVPLAKGVRGLVTRSGRGVIMDGKLTEWGHAYCTPVHYNHATSTSGPRSSSTCGTTRRSTSASGASTPSRPTRRRRAHVYNGDAVEFYLDTRAGRRPPRQGLDDGRGPPLLLAVRGDRGQAPMGDAAGDRHERHRAEGGRGRGHGHALGLRGRVQAPLGQLPRLRPEARGGAGPRRRALQRRRRRPDRPDVRLRLAALGPAAGLAGQGRAGRARSIPTTSPRSARRRSRSGSRPRGSSPSARGPGGGGDPPGLRRDRRARSRSGSTTPTARSSRRSPRRVEPFGPEGLGFVRAVARGRSTTSPPTPTSPPPGSPPGPARPSPPSPRGWSTRRTSRGAESRPVTSSSSPRPPAPSASPRGWGRAREDGGAWSCSRRRGRSGRRICRRSARARPGRDCRARSPRCGGPSCERSRVSSVFDLRAVRSGRVGSVEDEAAFSHGPSIVGLVDRVHGELVRIGALE